MAVSDALKQMARAPRYAEYFVHFVLVDSLDCFEQADQLKKNYLSKPATGLS